MQVEAKSESTNALDRGTLFFCVVFMALGGAMVWAAQSMTPMGAVFPRTIGLAMAVIAAVLFVVTLVRRGEAASHPPGSTPRRVALVLVMAAWVALLPTLGFFAASGLAFLALVLVANYEPWSVKRALVYGASAVALLAGFYVLFVELLHVPAPRGMLF